MTREKLAEKLNGMEYRSNIAEELIKEAQENGLVIVYGYSDDLMEFEGAITDELDCYGGGKTRITAEGVLNRPDPDDYEDEDDLYDSEWKSYLEKKERSRQIEAVWCDNSRKPFAAWTFKTDIPHSTFNVMEEDEIQCIGMVFDTSDL